MQINHIYIINIRSSFEDIQNRINGLGLPYGINFTVVNGINGRRIVEGLEEAPMQWSTADWWKIEGHPNSWWSRDVNAAEIGCTLSHIQVWVDALKNGYKNILVLEEDFISSGNGWPSDQIMNQIPDNYDFMYMGRRRVPGFDDIPHSTDIVRANYSYNTHAYLISNSGIQKALQKTPMRDLIPADELIPGLMGVHPRHDVINRYKVEGFNAFAFNKPDLHFITQTAIMKESINNNIEILDTSDWNAWVNKYITPVMIQKDFELLTDEIGPSILEFPLFTDRFCEELIQLAETRGEWTVGRHEFYPTNDMLINSLGLGEIYTRVIQEFVAPLAIWYWTLEDAGWDTVVDETFMIRYRPDKQGHLSLHHDYSSYTCAVKLNDEFEGGGTFFPRYQITANPKRVGNAILHPGMITHRHGGRPVYSGTRYITVSFIKNANIIK
jgi:hypothetical protein